MREMAVPPATFTAAVMARVGQERWKTERAIDLGFNLAIAAGVLVILAGGAGLAWSLGLLTITIDVEAIWQARRCRRHRPRAVAGADDGDGRGAADDGVGAVVVGRNGRGLAVALGSAQRSPMSSNPAGRATLDRLVRARESGGTGRRAGLRSR